MTFEPLNIPIREIIRETDDCVSILLDVPTSQQASYAYQPGQYLTIEWDGKKGPVRRAYSLSSAPHENRWRITVKKHDKGFLSGILHDKVKAGDMLRVLPPMGRFTVKTDADKRRGHFFITAGSGITPVLSLIRAILEEEPQSFCYLLYGSRDEAHIIFKDELDALVKRYTGQLEVVHTLSRPDKSGWLSKLSGSKSATWTGDRGRIDGEKIRQFKSGINCPYKDHHWYLCGPSGLMDTCDKELKALQIPTERISREHFDADPLPATGTGVAAELTTNLHGEAVSVHVNTGQTLLQALLAAGHDAPYSCSSGACASCMAKIVDGEVLMEHAPALEKSEIAEGYILTCQAKAKTASIQISYP